MSISPRNFNKREGVADKIVKKFTTTTTNYDLLADTTIKNAILNFYTEADYNLHLIDGISLAVTIYFGTATGVKINGQNFYNDLIEDSIFSNTNKFKSIVVEDTGVSGTIEIIIL